MEFREYIKLISNYLLLQSKFPLLPYKNLVFAFISLTLFNPTFHFYIPFYTLLASITLMFGDKKPVQRQQLSIATS